MHGQNFRSKFRHSTFPKSLAIGQKFSKIVIALEGKLILLGFFLLSLGPTYGHDITSKAIFKLVTLPHKICIRTSSISDDLCIDFLIKITKFLFIRCGKGKYVSHKRREN